MNKGLRPFIDIPTKAPMNVVGIIDLMNKGLRHKTPFYINNMFLSRNY